MKYFLIKTKTYAAYTFFVLAPTWYALHNFESGYAHLLSFAFSMLALHIAISEDSQKSHENLRNLVMRKRHFNG